MNTSANNSQSIPDYLLLSAQVKALVADAPTEVAFLSNVSALLNEALMNINWVGFYEVRNDEMTLGPFQGKVACVRIPYGKGVCGTAWAQKEIIRVQDVHLFDGHIACDSASNSEIVLPILDEEGEVILVLDIDSPLTDRFSEGDELGLTWVRDAVGEGLRHIRGTSSH